MELAEGENIHTELTPTWHPLPQSWKWSKPGTNWMLSCSVCWRRVTWTGWDLLQLGSKGWEPWVGVGGTPEEKGVSQGSYSWLSHSGPLAS